MTLDLDLDATGRAIADAVTQFCRERCGDPVVKAAATGFPRELWRALAALDVLRLATPEGGGGALEIVAAMEALGAAVFPGPLAETFFASQLLPEAERGALAAGAEIVSVGTVPLMPWAGVAGIFVEVEGARAWRARPRSPVETVETLGGEPWGRVELERELALEPVGRARALAEIARAAYLVAAGERLVGEASDHARNRTQFGRPIGDFQAVAHPLADCSMRLAAAATLARAAAFHVDQEDPAAEVYTEAARISAREAALAAAYTGHQVFGAIGVTLDGPVFHVSRRIRQLASQRFGAEPTCEVVLDAFRIGGEPG